MSFYSVVCTGFSASFPDAAVIGWFSKVTRFSGALANRYFSSSFPLAEPELGSSVVSLSLVRVAGGGFSVGTLVNTGCVFMCPCCWKHRKMLLVKWSITLTRIHLLAWKHSKTWGIDKAQESQFSFCQVFCVSIGTYGSNTIHPYLMLTFNPLRLAYAFPHRVQE